MDLDRWVTSKDIDKGGQILIAQRYLHSAQSVGEQLRYVVIWILGWCRRRVGHVGAGRSST
jgi:hypothetical protein